jgi:hypothetical protein
MMCAISCSVALSDIVTIIGSLPKMVCHEMVCHPEQALFARRRIPGEPREASRSLRRNNRASGSLPY